MSPVTFSIAQCALRASSSAPPSRPGRVERPGSPSSGRTVPVRRQTRDEEPVHAADAVVGPVGVLLGRAEEQDVAARGVRAVALDDTSTG